jgi:cytoskeletal protein RodZ
MNHHGKVRPAVLVLAAAVLGVVVGVWYALHTREAGAPPPSGPAVASAPASQLPGPMPASDVPPKTSPTNRLASPAKVPANRLASSAAAPANGVASPPAVPANGPASLAAVSAAAPAAPPPPADEPTPAPGTAETQATDRMIAAHASLRTPAVADPDSKENRAILQTMLSKALTRKDAKPPPFPAPK